MRHFLFVFAALLAAAPALAEVKLAAPDGLLVQHEAVIATSPATVYRALGRIGSWWSPAHTWSGDAGNLHLELEAGGCFCERWKTGSAVHGRVVMARRNELLRLDATLGPLQEMALSGTLSFALEPAARETKVSLTYRVSGDEAHGLDKIAPGVDQVLGEQLARLKLFVETGKADAP